MNRDEMSGVRLDTCELCPTCQETLAKKKEKLKTIICQQCGKNRWEWHYPCTKCDKTICNWCLNEWTSGYVDTEKGTLTRTFKCKCSNIIVQTETWDGDWRS